MKTKTGEEADGRSTKNTYHDHYPLESDADSGNENKEELKQRDINMSSLESRVEDLRHSLVEKQSKKDSLERDLHEMNSTIQKYQEGVSGDEAEELDRVENGDKYLSDKDSLVFHGVEKDP